MEKANPRCHRNRARSLLFSLPILVFIFSACGLSFQVGGEIQAGRYALLTGKPDLALPHFQRAAELDGNYILDFSPFQEGVWTYVGRAYYATGRLADARAALERARSRHEHDYLAHLYLGLVLARDGDRDRGRREIEGGMKGIHDWLDYVTYNTYYGHFWDPLREIRSEIQSSLAMTSGKDLDWQRLIASAEWVGKKMEEEIDNAQRDKARDQDRQSEGRDGKP